MPSPRTARSVEALLHDLGPRLRRGEVPEEQPGRCPTGIPAVDRLLGGGFPRGRLSEVAGPTSSGRTSLARALLARTTGAGEVAALVDRADAFDPGSAARGGVDLDRVLWVRAPRLREALRCAERLLRVHGFGLVLLDLARPVSAPSRDLGPQASSASRPARAQASSEPSPGLGLQASSRLDPGLTRPRRGGTARGRRRRAEAEEGVPHAHWLRLARAAASTRTALVVLSSQRGAGPAAELALELAPARPRFTGTPSLLEGLDVEITLARSRGAAPARAPETRGRW